MNPAHLSALRLISTGCITFTGCGPRAYRHDGSPVEPFTTSVLNDLVDEGYAETPDYSDTVKLAGAGWTELERVR